MSRLSRNDGTEKIGMDLHRKAEEILRNRFLGKGDKAIRNKVCPLRDAIERNVKPGMTLHLTFTGSRWPTAAVYEIFRQFQNSRANFSIASLTVSGPLMILVHGDMVSRVITSYCGDSYHTIRPNPVYQRAFRDGKIVFENWSVLTFVLRLMAGAMKIGFVPTNSLMGSTMAVDNTDSLKVIEDPFESGRELPVLKPLVPDLSIAHALASDEEGNAIFFPPYAENLYGAMASRSGTILTVEKILPPETIKRYSYLVKLPSQYVVSVCEVPFGAHPGGVSNLAVQEVEGYMEDYEFFDNLHRVAKEPEQLDKWIAEWVLGCDNHDQYLKKLGSEKILYLKGRLRQDSWMLESKELMAGIDLESDYTSLEMAIIAASRRLADLIKDKGYSTILAGAGLANLASSLAYYRLVDKGRPVDLMVEMGLYGYTPRPFDPAILNFRNHPTCKMLADVHWIMGILMGGRNNSCIGCIGAAEIDRFGNINSTQTDVYIGGSGGANDIVSCSREVLSLAIQSANRFVERVSYVTSPGLKVNTLVSTLGIYEKEYTSGEFVLKGFFPDKRFSSDEENIRHIKENCGWDLRVSTEVEKIYPPTPEELLTLRMLDPHRYFLGKID